MSDEQELKRRLGVIEKVFNTEKLATRGQDSSDIERYYKESSWGYRLFHSGQGAMHMAFNPDGVFDQKGYFGQADAIAKWFTSDTKEALELASGNGFNACYLAEGFPDIKFTGIDLVGSEVEFAGKRARGTDNLVFTQGNFQCLPFHDRTFDLVYVVESMCHATNMRQALNESYRVLRPSGLLIVIDAWQTETFDQLPPLVQKAALITQQSMAVGRPWKLDEWQRLADQAGFIREFEEDFTTVIMPNLLRFEKMAARYFANMYLARILARLLPDRLLENAIAGYLMPMTVNAGAHTYRMVVLRRQGGAERTLA